MQGAFFIVTFTYKKAALEDGFFYTPSIDINYYS